MTFPPVHVFGALCFPPSLYDVKRNRIFTCLTAQQQAKREWNYQFVHVKRRLLPLQAILLRLRFPSFSARASRPHTGKCDERGEGVECALLFHDFHSIRHASGARANTIYIGIKWTIAFRWFLFPSLKKLIQNLFEEVWRREWRFQTRVRVNWKTCCGQQKED